jgi:uncharacterized protein (DUF58 family)
MALGSPIPGAQFVDPAVLARVGNLDLVARSVVDGVINGLHRAPYFGASVDFAEHRGYVAGDDIRRVDWKVYARTDRYFVKEFEADTNSNFVVLLDISASMNFGARVSKLDYGKTLAACLLYLVHQQRDRVGLSTFDEGVVDYVPPSAKHLEVALHALDRAKATKPGRIREPLRTLSEHFGRRGIVVLISDLYDEPEAIFDAIAPIRLRGSDVIVFHVLDEAEITFPYTEASAFEDLETGDQLPVVPESFAEQYRAMIQAHIAALGQSASGQGIDYRQFTTSRPLDFALYEYLSFRDRTSRVR